MEYAEYKKLKGITNTALSNFSPNGKDLRPDMYNFWITTGQYLPATPALAQGSINHDLLFEKGQYEKRFAVFDESQRPVPDSNFNKTENKEWKENFLALATKEKKQVITKDQFDIARRIRDNAYKIEPIKEILEYTRNVFETPIQWRVDGVDYKAKPDINSDIFLVDGKSCRDCGGQFIFDFRKYRYHRESGMYFDGDKRVNGISGKEYYFIAMETVEPFGMHLYKVSDKVLGYGRDEYLFLGKELAAYKKRNHWPTLAEISPYTEIDY